MRVMENNLVSGEGAEGTGTVFHSLPPRSVSLEVLLYFSKPVSDTGRTYYSAW